MTNYQPDVLEQVPVGGNVMQPESGTYGDQVALDDLAGAAGGGAPPPGASGPAPPIESFNPATEGDDEGLPGALLAPTLQPDVPVASPLAAMEVNPVADAGTSAQKRLVLLDQLSNSQEVSPETRELAKLMLEKLAGRSSG